MLKGGEQGKKIHICNLLFTDDAAIVIRSAKDLQMYQFSAACKNFGMKIRVKSTKFLNIDGCEVEAVNFKSLTNSWKYFTTYFFKSTDKNISKTCFFSYFDSRCST